MSTDRYRLVLVEGKYFYAFDKPVPQIQIAILKDTWGSPIASLTPLEFEKLQVPMGDVGEICVTGDHVLKGYLNGTGNAETKICVGDVTWHRTGDAGYLDTTHRLWLLGRCSARITDKEGTLYPFTAECIAQTFSFIHRSAYLEVASKRILALEYLYPPSDSELLSLGNALKSISISHAIRLTKIPVDKRHNAKVDYPALRKILE